VIYGTVNVAVVAIVTFASLISAVVRSARTQISLNQHGVRTPRHNPPSVAPGLLLTAPSAERTATQIP